MTCEPILKDSGSQLFPSDKCLTNSFNQITQLGSDPFIEENKLFEQLSQNRIFKHLLKEL